jgi:hypothetical protein
MESIVLNQKQYDAITNEEPVFGFLGGVGAGKSVSGSHFAKDKIEDNPEQVGLIFANTNKQLYTATLKVFKEVLKYYGYEKDVHYVVDRDPKAMFGYQSRFDKHSGIWSFYQGAQVMVFSLESTMEGIEVGWVWGDEIQDAQEEQLTVVLARARGAKNPQILYTLTPPKGNKFIDNLLWGNGDEPGIPHVVSTTYDNARNLPDSYIPMLKKQYDRLTFDREVLAKRVAAVKNRWAYALDDDKVMNKVFTKGLTYNRGLPVYLAFDFNKEPMTCIAVQRWNTKIRVIKEFRLDNSNIRSMCERIRHYYGLSNYYVTGDASGSWSDNPLQDKFQNYYEAIALLLRIPEANFNVPSKNPFHTVSRQQVNAILENHPDILIDEVECPFLKDDLLYVEANEDGTINKNKDKRKGHLLDGFRYDLYVYEQDYLAFLPTK